MVEVSAAAAGGALDLDLRDYLEKCPRFMCMIHCEFGREVDENGCDLCRCKPPRPSDLVAAVAAVGSDSLTQPLHTPNQGRTIFREIKKTLFFLFLFRGVFVLMF